VSRRFRNPNGDNQPPRYRNTNKKNRDGYQQQQQQQNEQENRNFRPRLKQKVVLQPKNLAQETYIDALQNPDLTVVFAVGAAGTGKTYLATMWAIHQLKTGQCDKIVISRPNVAVDDKDIGFLPGDIMAKMAPWTRPVLDVFEEYFSVKEITSMIEDNVIEMVPLAYIRGRTFKNAVVLLDEAQNTTRNSMLSALTRIGENCRMVVTGDIKQSDRGASNGLTDFLERFSRSQEIAVCHFGPQHVERHPVISEILKIYGEE